MSEPAPQAPHVREIRDDEHDVLGELLLRAYDRVGPFDDDYRRFLGDPSRWVPGTTATFVAERDGEPLGCVGFVLPGDAEFEHLREPVADCGFRFLAVDPAAQGSGAGRALVERCISAARRRDCVRMVIHSMAFMTVAHRLYERLGFTRRPDLDVTFPSGIGLAFQLDLAPDAPGRFPPPGPAADPPPWYEELWGATDDHDRSPTC